MGGLTNGGGGGEGGGQPVPQPDLVEQAKQLAAGLKDAGLWERFWAAFHASRAKGHGYFFSVLSPVVEISLTEVIGFITQLQGKDNPEFYTFTAGLMSDLLGVEVNADVMRESFVRGGDVSGMRAVGAAFVKQLAGEFGATLDFDNDRRLAPAQVFLGFLISFAVRAGNVTFLTGLLPEIHADDIREYGEQMATNLGLGRLARRALGPFIDDLVGKPMQDALRQQLRPTDLNVAEATRAFNRRFISEEQFNSTLAKLGYSDDLRDALQAEYLSHLAPDEILALGRYGDLDDNQVLDALTRLGYTAETADLLRTAHRHLREDSAVDFYLGVLREQVRAGFFDAEAFSRLLDLLPLDSDFKERERKIVGQILEQPRRRLTLSEMRKFFAEGLIDLGDWDDFLAAEGYSDQAQKLLTFDLLQTSPVEADKLAAAELKQKLADLALAKKAIRAGLLPPGSPPP